MDKNVAFYNQHANDLLVQYESTRFIDVHADWIHLLPKTGDVLDVGAGTGRDSAYMAHRGLCVFAVEPAASFRALGSTIHPHTNITWLDDTLPDLNNIIGLNKSFDLILLSAVWMHVPVNDRQSAMNTLCSLLQPHASIIITLRHGDSGDERIMYPVSHDEIKHLLKDTKFISTLLNEKSHSADTLGRQQVSWQTVQISAKETSE